MLNLFNLTIKAHGTWFLSLEDILLAGSEECYIEEDHQNIKIVVSYVLYNAYTLLMSGNMWYDTNILKVHPNGMATFLKNIHDFSLNVILVILQASFLVSEGHSITSIPS